MAFSGGTFSRTFDCTTDRDNGVKILASKFDTELDGMATGLSTCILKDGTQTCTAAIPFAQGITLPDNKTIILGTNSDVTIQYDETTNDSLEIAANVEGAALGIVLKADQGDDAGDEWKLNIADGGTLTLGNDIASAGSYVTHLTITPNSTVASSTTAVAGNLTVGGALTLGSGAVISEAELETIDGITPGTAAASKAMVLDASLDISGGRNLTISGELDAATLDVSGDVDIDGTLETDALSIASTAVTATAAELNILDGVTSTAAELNILDGVTATTAELNYSDTGAAVGTVVASKVVTADANKDVASFRNITLTGELDAGSLDVSGDADIDGTLEADAMTLNGTAITATATLDTGISNNNVPKFTSGVADDDFLRVAGTAIEGRSAAEVLSDIGASAVAGSSSIVTTGALNAGSITSGFGSIDNGSSAITTTGVGSFGSLDISGDIDIDGTTNLDAVDIDGAVDMASTLQVDGAITSSAGATITTADNTAQLILKSTDADASVGPLFQLHRDSSSPADDDAMGTIDFRGENSASEIINYVRINTRSADVTDGTEDAKFDVNTYVAGASVNRFSMTPTETVFNEDSVDVDFRVEGNGDANLLYVDAGNDRIGIGTASPDSLVHINGANPKLHIRNSSDSNRGGYLQDDGTSFVLGSNSGVRNLVFSPDNTERMRILTDGRTSIGHNAAINISILGISNRNATSDRLFAVHNAGGTSGFFNQIAFRNNADGATIGEIVRVNDASVQYNTSSDYRLKTEVTYDWNATTRLKQLKPARFKWISEGDTAEFVDGFLANEAQTVVPEAVSGTHNEVEVWKDGEELLDGVSVGDNKLDADGNTIPVYQGIDQSKIVPLVTKALIESVAKIEALEARITALEAG